MWPLLLVVGGLLACGGERPDATASGDLTAAAKPAPTPPGGECRRFVTCVPENPCHTGWVTGCRKNVPICTDIGGWLDNGRTCGSAAVCFMGQCVPCAAGETCTVRDQWQNEIQCRAGAISCASGQPVCQDVGVAADGRACWDGAYEAYVCRGGQCVWCMDGDGCSLPDQPCHVAQMTGCTTNGGACTDTGAFVSDGSSCPARNGDPYTGVCLAGGCNACDWYQSCEPPPSMNECIEQAAYGYTWCASGAPECVPSWSSPKPDGTACSTGVCAGGTCTAPCVPDQPCTQGCSAGVTACSGPYTYCALNGPAPDGTACGTDAFCTWGGCQPCGAACAPRDFCHGAGTISCASGLCDAPAQPDGTSCGAGTEACAGGVCAGPEGAAIVTRGQTGVPVDLSGITWSRCEADLGTPSSRRWTEVYGPGTLHHVEETFEGTTDCTGPGVVAFSVDATVTSAGYRYATWAGERPAGTPDVPIATAVTIGVVDDPQIGTLTLRFLLWVDDAASPRALYQGEGKGGDVAADGYPLRLYAMTDPLREMVSRCGAPCDPGFATCAAYAVDCSGPSASCAPTGATLADREPCGDGMTCTGGVCGAVTLRTVTGTAETTFWPDAGASLPALSYYWWKSAIVFTGQTTTRQVDADSMGSPFTIAGVPQATYLLALSGVPTTGRTYHLAMAGGTWNAGIDVLGRSDLTWGAGAPVTLAVNGLVPVGPSDVVGLVCSNAGFATYPFGGPGGVTLPFGAETAVTTVSWYGPAIESAQGDVSYLFQLATTWDAVNGTSVSAVARWAALPDTLAFGSAPVTADVALEPCPESRSVSADWQLSQFAAYAPQVGQGATVRNGRMAIFARPHADPFAPGWRTGDTFGYPGGIPLLVVRGGTRTTDFPLSGVTYGRFLPPLWREYRLVRTLFDVPFTAPGASRPAGLSAAIGWIVPEDAAPATLVPMVSPPQGLRIGGQDAADVLNPPADVGLMPVISWTAPALLPATGAPIYEVTVWELKNAGGSTQLSQRYTGETARTSYRLPGTNLGWNGRYVVTVTATVSERSIYAPLHQPVVRAFATAVSQPFTP